MAEADVMLTNVVERVESRALQPLWMTLLLGGGTWCTGRLVDRTEWTETVLKAVEGHPVYLAAFGEYSQYDSGDEHLHLLHAQTFEGTTACPAAGTALRLRISDVSGWALGKMHSTPEDEPES